jgi:hypothetical protein
MSGPDDEAVALALADPGEYIRLYADQPGFLAREKVIERRRAALDEDEARAEHERREQESGPDHD